MSFNQCKAEAQLLTQFRVFRQNDSLRTNIELHWTAGRVLLSVAVFVDREKLH